jgi:6,7-dimethyl-8-ribityllumazine synthase
MTQKIAIISASWHKDIVNTAENSFRAAMKKSGFSGSIDTYDAPGSLEIPMMGKQLLESGYDMAIGMGFIVNGGIYRHEFVAQAVIDGIVNVSVETGKPFLSVVLTPITFTEGNEHHEKFFVDHMVVKGQEAANAATRMLQFQQNPQTQKKAA